MHSSLDHLGRAWKLPQLCRPNRTHASPPRSALFGSSPLRCLGSIGSVLAHGPSSTFRASCLAANLSLAPVTVPLLYVWSRSLRLRRDSAVRRDVADWLPTVVGYAQRATLGVVGLSRTRPPLHHPNRGNVCISIYFLFTAYANHGNALNSIHFQRVWGRPRPPYHRPNHGNVWSSLHST